MTLRITRTCVFRTTRYEYEEWTVGRNEENIDKITDDEI